MSNKNIVTGQLASITTYDPTTSQVEGIATSSVVANTVTGNTVSLGTGNLTLSGNLISSTADTITIDPLGDGTPAGNVVVAGNLQVAGNITYNDIINATTTDLRWIAANDAATTSLATGAGLAVGPAGAYAQFTYNSAANVWQSSLPLLANGGVNANGTLSGATTGSFSGNVTAPYFIGNGSQLTGLPAIYGNAQVANYLASNSNVDIFTTGLIKSSNNIITGGNIIGEKFIGDGSLLINLPVTYTNANVAAYLPTYTGNLTAGNVTVSGNVAATNIGNVAAKNLNGNVTTYLTGTGSWEAPTFTIPQALYGNATTTIVASTAISTNSAAPTRVMTFVIPTAGTWQINGTYGVRTTAISATTNYALYAGATPVAANYVTGTYGSGAAIGSGTGYNQVNFSYVVTTTGADTYTIGAYASAGAQIDPTVVGAISGNYVQIAGVGSQLPPAFSAYSTSSVVISGTFVQTVVPWNVEEYDSNGWLASNRYTPQLAGWYQISCCARAFTTSSANESSVSLRKNGVVIGNMGGYGTVTGAVSKMVFLNGSTDYVDVVISNQVAGTVLQAQDRSFFTGFWVRA